MAEDLGNFSSAKNNDPETIPFVLDQKTSFSSTSAFSNIISTTGNTEVPQRYMPGNLYSLEMWKGRIGETDCRFGWSTLQKMCFSLNKMY